ncbi:uncharacterized protein LOC130495727 [Raphanus sativus]|uniref:Uncharacterized protein LOC130495727 n=1 Tax=Raphanus sativus TaxID=3726 RepID=A0A9W3BVG3_RAPSA|nr:uncharacterized protein LOC130495727 [Raphanus sativus]
MADPQPPARPIGAYDRPTNNGQLLGIRAPAVAANNFEIKSGLLNQIENNKFHGLAAENPFDHLDSFDRYCGLSKTNGVSEDGFKLKLFPFSLGDKARQWEKSLLSSSITTWDDCKNAFLEKFFSTSKTADYMNEISGFKQKNLEGFSEAWERFNGYLAQCPHHGFNKGSLLSTFYRGALPEYRARLDTASNGNFLDRTEREAAQLVDNMVKSDAVYSGDHDRANRTDDKLTRRELKALQDKIDILIADKATQEQVHVVGNPQQETPPTTVNEVEGLEGQEELCFINSNGSCQDFRESVCFYGFHLQAANGNSTRETRPESHKVEQQIVTTSGAKIVEKVYKLVAAKVVKRDGHKVEMVTQEDTTEVEQSPYDKLPFPQRVLTKAQKKDISKFRKDLSDVGVKLPEISGMREAPVQMMLIQDILTHKDKVAELLDFSTLQLEPHVPPKSLPKQEHQGMFTLSCSLGKLTFDDALVDSGASVNVISIEMVKTLGIESMEPTRSLLQFGDSSSTTPIGLIKDFPMKIGACTIPVDLTVLKMATAKRFPLILGTPFLTTVGACIDFDNKKVTLLKVNKAVSYPLQPLEMKSVYCGTITCEASSIEKPKAEVLYVEKETLAGESSTKMCDEHLESAKKEEVSRATKATHVKKKMMKEPHPPPLDTLPHTLTLHPMKLKDGAIEYKIRCKGKTTSFSSARAIITHELQDDSIKLQELLSQVLTITLNSGKDPPSPLSI